MTFTPMMWRSALAKTLGLAVGLALFFALPSLFPDASLTLRLGMVVLFSTLGGIVGIVGFIQRVPLFDWHLSPALRGAVMGLWMGLLAALLGWDSLSPLLAGAFGWPAALTNPFWILLDCAAVGALIDLAVTALVGPVTWPETGLSEP